MAELMIESVGHRADGVAHLEGRTVFVPYTLPGERVTADIDGERARNVQVLDASPDRVEAPCPHFGVCGGCLLQHMAAGPYLDFKRRLVVDALADRGLSPEVGLTIATSPHARRRATFAGMIVGHRAVVGFNERASHRIVPIEVCFVVVPGMLAVMPALEAITSLLQPKKTALDLTVTMGEHGFDVAVSGIAAKDVERVRLPLIDLAVRFDLARLAVAGEAVVERRAPVVMIDGLPVVPPPGGFLQASPEAEEAMAAIVLAAMTKAKKVADLYAGVGTFSLRLARGAEVFAAEGDAGAVAALDKAARMAGRRRVVAERRDLARRPLVEKELDAFDAVVFDPPRTGAAEQSGWIARSKVPTVVAVSCNPATLARDLRVMVDGGYRIESVTPVDQFLWSSHIEVVTVLQRG